ncbi:MAG: dynamin [Acaryochloris sp. RU_4_1]|nr:dynamin [Acaryochloris sp. RU_4_1]NJR53891.1 dynamin [Acaryochloris sp. CRU_2_0]
MNPPVETASFLQDLDRIARIRQQIATHLDNIAATLSQAEQDGQTASGSLQLQQEIEDVGIASQNLKQGVFRLMVLGDMKRGKSTFLNALIGENLLPSDVNPCTALLTILKYGRQKTVTIHFHDGKSPEQIDFARFKERYTIDPEEAKQLEAQQQIAFPDVSHAVVEYPLPLLGKGVEIVDSPGLNDTEARNDLSLGYLQNCHAILFVLRATQPCTLAERRYLENYIKGRGLSIFFLINAWDQIQDSLLDPEDPQELEAATRKLHQVFRTNLEEYCQVDGYDVYEERVFAISALQTLRQRLKDPNAEMAGTGFPAFLGALNTFLTQERAVSELRQARTLARQALDRVQEATALRIPLLDQSLQELEERIHSVEPEFAGLKEIGDHFRYEIDRVRDQRSRTIAESFRTYVLGLETTFDQDFLKYQPPNLELLDLFNQGRREAFNAAFQKAFQQYVNDKFFAWTRQAEAELKAAFAQLSQSAERYGTSYTQITDRITEKLTGQTIQPRPSKSEAEDNAPGWAKWAMGLFSLASGNLSGAAMAATGFDFQSILLNFFTSAGIALIASSVFGIILGPITFALVGLGIGVLQADHARKQLTQATKAEFSKCLPQIAQDHYQPIYNTIHECFDAYNQEVRQRLQADIQARQQELENLRQQKASRQIDCQTEVTRLQTLENRVSSECQSIEVAYQSLLSF